MTRRAMWMAAVPARLALAGAVQPISCTGDASTPRGASAGAGGQPAGSSSTGAIVMSSGAGGNGGHDDPGRWVYDDLLFEPVAFAND